MTLTVRSATVNGATTKGSALSHAEMDENWNHVANFTQSGSGAVIQSTQTKLRRIKELDDRESVDNTGATSILTQFKNAVADVGTGGRLIVRRGTYKFTLASYTDTILLPSDFWLDCEEGVVFKWDWMGGALMAAVEKENVLITGPMFEWNGTLANVAGSNTNTYGWTGTTAALRDFCCDVLSLGSTGVRVRHSGHRVVGDAPTLASEAFAIFAGFFPDEDDTTRTADCEVTDCRIDDVVQGVLFSGQDNMTLRDLKSRRFPGNHALGGGNGVDGHIIYATDAGPRSRGLTIRDIRDHGSSYGTITGRSDSSVQVKASERAIISGVSSARPTGVLTLADFVRGTVSDVTWNPATVESNGMSSAAGSGAAAGLTDSTLQNLNFFLPDSTDKAAWNMNSMDRCVLKAMISAAHTTTSISSSLLTDCQNNRVEIDYMARNTTTAAAINFAASPVSSGNSIYINPIGPNHRVRPFVNNGSLNNDIQIRDNVTGIWSNLSQWTTEADSPAIGFLPIKKTKVYRIGTTTNPTTTFQLPRAGVWVGVCSLIEASGAHSLSGLYRIAWDAGSLQSVELLGTQWTIGASAPTVLGLAVSNAGVVTVTSTAGSASWDIQYDLTCMGNYRYADF